MFELKLTTNDVELIIMSLLSTKYNTDDFDIEQRQHAEWLDKRIEKQINKQNKMRKKILRGENEN